MTRKWTTVTEKDQVTTEILDAAEQLIWEVFGWDLKKPIDWDNFINRLDCTPLKDGTELDLGNSYHSPAIRHIKAHIIAYRKLG